MGRYSQELRQFIDKLAQLEMQQRVGRDDLEDRPSRRSRAAMLQMAKRAAFVPRMSKRKRMAFPKVKQMAKRAADMISGGLADSKPASAFNPASLAKGISTEKEHTTNPQIAKEIAKDHLSEDPKYYKKLSLIEGKGKDKPKYAIQSQTDPSKTYRLSVSAQGNVTCSCTGFRYKRTCHHVTKMREALGSGDLAKHNIQKVAAAFENALIKEAERDYKDEYAKFQSSRESKVDRAHRNKVRRRLLASGRVEKHDGKDIDHKDGNPRNNGGDNISVTSKSYNRGKH